MKSEVFSPLFGDLVPQNVYAVYGVPNVGKTVMAMTEVANLAAQEIRTLWIDTEGGLNFEPGQEGIWNTWKPRLEARFGVKNLNEWVEYHQFLDYEELTQWLGYPVKVEYGDNKIGIQLLGKIKKWDGTVYDNGQFGRKRDNCAVVLDSMSSLFRLQFGSTLQNFPGRGDATAYLIWSLEKLIKRVNAPLITTNHASLNPTNQWQMASMRGGSTVAYYSKNVAYLEKPKARALDTFRKMSAVRSPRAKEWGAETMLRIDTDKGFVLSSFDEAKAAVELAKAAKQAKKEQEEAEE